MDLYVILKGIHNITRWLVLLAGLWAIISSFSGLIGRRKWTSGDRTAGLAFSALFGIQLILGLVLYGVSPVVRAGIADYANAATQVKFFTVYHLVIMFIAFILAQLGYSRSKKAVTDGGKFRIAAIFYTLSMLLTLMIIPWGFRPNWPSYLFGG